MKCMVFFLETSGCKSRKKSHNNMRYETKRPNNTFHARLRKPKSTLLVTLAETCTRALVYGCMHVCICNTAQIYLLPEIQSCQYWFCARTDYNTKNDQCYCYWLLVTFALANNDTANAADATWRLQITSHTLGWDLIENIIHANSRSFEMI